MSTYLKTAAMSLLSKTLQTFLSKYLKEVDVEGVALPSVYDGSGWGVRLSNVKLREGVELMKTMPGGIVRKRRRRRRRRHTSKNNQKNSSMSDKSHPSERPDNIPDGSVANEMTNTTELNEEFTVEKLKDGNNSGTINRGRSYSSSMTPPVMPTVDEGDDNMSSSDSIFSGDEGDDDGHARPMSPVEEQRQSFLSCFSSKRAVVSETNKKQTSTSSIDPPESNPTTSSTSDTTTPDESDSTRAASVEMHNPSASSTSILKDEDDGSNLNQSYGYDDDNDDDIDEDSFEIVEEEYEQKVRLCLGSDGRIGILDVRLIGKELHVMIEDADVTIEAIPILEQETEDDDGGNENPDDETAKTDDLDSSSQSKRDSHSGSGDKQAKSTDRRKSKTKPEPKRETVGDRVLADNPLARLISSIPHLFLRDIRIRLIVRDQAVSLSHEKAEGEGAAGETTNVAEADTSKTDHARSMPSSRDVMVEVGIDFLSVTSGDDVLSHFHEQAEGGVESLENSNGHDGSDGKLGRPPPLLKIPSHVSADPNGQDQTNEYIIRQIRTSRGPEGGIFVQIYAPVPTLHNSVTTATLSTDDVWARQRWMLTTEHRLLRLSGLDALARIHVGTKKVDNGYSWFYGEYVDEDEANSDIESLILFGGIDTVAPGPQLPLPPMEPRPPKEPRMSRGMTPRKSNSRDDDTDHGMVHAAAIVAARENADPDNGERDNNEYSATQHYDVDKNGIQSCKIPSLFHRVSRGMEPASCKDCRSIPSEASEFCWQSPGTDIKNESSLDSSIPLPGLAFQISFRDTLEVNIDRSSLESISLLKSLFVKPVEPSSEDDGTEVGDNDDEGSKAASTTVPPPSPQIEETTRTTSATTGFFTGMFYGTNTEEVVPEEPSEAFESYMQPEKISVVGMYITSMIFRIHVLKPRVEDRGLGFCFWDFELDCLTIDRQTLAADEKTFQDVKLDVGHVNWKEYRGTDSREVVSLGIPQNARRRTDSLTSVSSTMDDNHAIKAQWPSTACALLDIPPPMESIVYKSRERHGIQLRYVSLGSPQDPESVAKTQLYLRLGVTSVDSPYAIKNEISGVITGFMDYLRARRPSSSTDNTQAEANDPNNATRRESTAQRNENDPESKSPSKSLMMFTMQIDSGNINLPPLASIKLPLTRFSGERSSSAGLFFETVLDKLIFSYGVTEKVPRKGCPTLTQLASLPENVRMHILLCLKDLTPLEKALGLKHEKNSFRRIKSVDKGMLKAAKTLTKRESKHVRNRSKVFHGKTPSSNRREEILAEIMSLDDAELAELWTVHHRYQKKLEKRRKDGHHPSSSQSNT